MATKKKQETTSIAPATEPVPKNKGGRPRKQLSKTTFESLLKINPTQDEVCAVLNTNKNTLNSWCRENYGEGFLQLLKKGCQEYKTSLRRNLLKLSSRNASVAIFLAKNYLGMSDNPVPIPNGTEQQTFQRTLTKAARLWDEQEQPQTPTDALEALETSNEDNS